MSFDGIADFRSDTVTRPTPDMYEAMTSAPLGDDVFADDPSVIALEEFAADLFGKEAGLFVPSGTMGNQIAVRVHTRQGDEIIVEQSSHTYIYEQGGAAQLSGVQPRPLAGDRGVMDLELVRSVIRPDNEHFPVTTLIILENTHNGSGGSILGLDYMKSIRGLADEHGLRVHLDGARLCNASAATGISLSDYASVADSVSCCLSKGLGAPVGTVVAGSSEFVREARRVRKVFGGGMRQAGVLAAPGLVALRDMRERLVEDHRRAAELARGFSECPGLSVVDPETNMVYVTCPGRAPTIADSLREHNVWTLALDADTLRFVTHKDLDDGDIRSATEAIKSCL